MAIPLPSAIATPGLSDDTNYALELDTRLRFDNMRTQEPMPFDIPKIQREPQTSILGSGSSPTPITTTIGEGLMSSDPKQVDLANRYFDQQLNARATKTGAGAQEYFNYDKSMDKFLNQDSGYNPYIGLEGNEANSYAKYLNKSFFGKSFSNIGVGLGRFTGGVLAKTVQTFGNLGSLLVNGVQELIYDVGRDVKTNNAMADIADNGLSRWAQDMEQNMKDSSLLSVFKPGDWQEKGFFSKLGNAAFWTDEVADGAAFMGEMVLSTYLLGAAGKAVGLSKLGATTINTASKLGKAGKVLDYGIKALTGANDIAGIGRWAFLTTSESAMEAAEGYKTTKERLTLERKMGKNTMSDEEINTVASEGAASRFKDNMLILGLSSGFENRFIFEPLFGKKGRWIRTEGEEGKLVRGSTRMLNQADPANYAKLGRPTYKTKFGEFTNWKDANSRLRFYGGRGTKATIAEGYWEENAQLATERLSADENYQNGSWWDRKTDLLGQTFKQARDASTWLGGKGDNEASTSIGLGGVIGIIGTGGIAKLAGGSKIDPKSGTIDPKTGKIDPNTQKRVKAWGKGERRDNEDFINSQIETYEKARKEFMNFQDIHERDENGVVKRDDDGNLIIDEAKAAGILKGLYDIQGKIENISEIRDPLYKKFLQEDALSDYIMAAKSVGVFNRMKGAFDRVGTMKKEDIENLGFDSTTVTDPAMLKGSIESINKAFEEEFENPDKIQTLKEGQTAREELMRRFNIFKGRVRMEAAKKILPFYSQSLEDKDFYTISGTAVKNAPDVVKYNKLQLKLLGLAEFAQIHEGLEFYKEYIEQQKKAIEAEIATVFPLIQPRLTNNEVQFFSGSSLIVTPDRYDELLAIRKNEGLAKLSDSIAIIDQFIKDEYSSIRKAAEMENIMAQYEFRNGKFSNAENGIANFQEFDKLGALIAARDTEAEKEEQAPKDPAGPANPTPPADSAIKEYTVRPTENGFGAFGFDGLMMNEFDNEADAQAWVKNLNDQDVTLKAQKAEAARLKKIEDDKKELERKRKEDPATMTYDELKEQAFALLSEVTNEPRTDQNAPSIDDRIAGIAAFIALYHDNKLGAYNINDEGIRLLEEFVKRHNELVKSGAPAQTELEIKKADIERRSKENQEQILIKANERRNDVNVSKAINDHNRGLITLEELDAAFKKWDDENGLTDLLIIQDELKKELAALEAPLAGTELTKAEQIAKMFEGITADEGARIKILEYFDRIKAGQEFEVVMDGLGESFRLPVRQLLQKEGIPFTEKSKDPEEEKPEVLSSDLVQEVRDAYRLHEQALLNGTTFEEEAKKEGLIIHNNQIDNAIDGSKNDGSITFVTSNLKELKPGGTELITNDSTLEETKHNFLHKLGSGELNKNDFKLSLQLSEKGNIYAVVTDSDGKALDFATDGSIAADGSYLAFFLDTDLYNAANLDKKRQDVVKFGPIAPLTSSPLSLHSSFMIDGNPRPDVLEILKDRIRAGVVLANMDVVMQGLLAREGQDNSFATIPSGKAISSATELFEKGHMVSRQGDILDISITIDGVYRRAGRINFTMLRDIKDKSKGTETIEFRPAPIGEVKLHDGRMLADSKVQIGDEEVSLLQAAVEGRLPNDREYRTFLATILRPDLFTVINLGNTLMVINLANFKNFVTQENITVEELRKVTTVEDIKASPLNIFKAYYSTNPVNMYNDILKDGDYMGFINDNVKTSSITVKRSAASEGYSRFNKRIIVTLQDNMEDMIKKNSQEKVIEETPNNGVVTVGEDMTDEELIKAMNDAENISPDDIEDGLTNVNCK